MCDCDTCSRNKRYSRLIGALRRSGDYDSADVVEDLVQRLIDAETQADHYKAVNDGKGPGSERSEHNLNDYVYMNVTP